MAKQVARPKTMREMQAEKQAVKDVGELTINNVSKQLIKIHLRAPMGPNGKKIDFYFGAQDINLLPGQTHRFKKDRLWMGQVERLQKQGKVQVVTDTDKLK